MRRSSRPRSKQVLLEGECSYRCADPGGRFNFSRVLVLNKPPARFHLRAFSSGTLSVTTHIAIS